MVEPRASSKPGGAPLRGPPGGPGARSSNSTEAATRSAAEVLFESRTVAEIREIEARTRRDIETKKQQLRQLVGDSHRDLIDSADKIVGIANNCNMILQSVKDIQQGFSFLTHSFATADSVLNEKRESMSRHEVLHAVSSRVRYLVETPEVIWGHLDGGQHLDAGRRLGRAHVVRSLLKSSFAPDLLAKFPLLANQWPLVAGFRSQIASAASAALAAPDKADFATAANALGALALLERLDGAVALRRLLAARRSAFRALLSPRALTDRATTDQAARTLAAAAGLVQATVQQLGQLFLSQQGSGGASGCGLQAAVRDDEVEASELVFGGGGAQAAFAPTVAAAAPELAQWLRDAGAAVTALAPLPPGALEAAVTGGWLQELAADAADAGAGLLAACEAANEVVDVERRLRAAMDGWHPAADPVPGSVAVLNPGAPTATWDAVCEGVLGAPLPLWQSVFEPLFLARAKALLADRFAGISDAVPAQLDTCLAAAAAAPPQLPGQVTFVGWPAGGEGDDPRACVAIIQAAVETRLSDALQAALALIGEARGGELEAFVQSRCAEAANGLAAALAGKLLKLGAPPVGPAGVPAAEQALVIGRVASALAWDTRLLGVLLGPPHGWRVAGATAGSTAAGSGPVRRGGAPAAAAPSRLMQGVVDALRATAAQAYGLWARWAAGCLVAGLRAGLVTDATLTASAAGPAPPTWQETVLPPAEEGDGELRFALPGGPSAAAAALLAGAMSEARRPGDAAAPPDALQALAWEVLGGVLACLGELVYGLGGGADDDDYPGSSAVGATPASPALARRLSLSLGSALSERGVLQLLFDVRLLREVLAGGRPCAATDLTALAAALTERRRAGTLLEQRLQDRLDPIDWATYEPHLWAGVRRHMARCAVLYGGLTQIARLAPQQTGPATSQPGAAGLLNTLGQLPPAPRFQYLPVTVPTGVSGTGPSAAGGGSLAASRGRPSNKSFARLLPPRAGTASSSQQHLDPSESASDLAGLYSFATLGAGAAGGQRGAGSAAAAAAGASNTTAGSLGASASNALGALQARLGGGSAFGSLGLLLGDKAAEVSAMAQQARLDLVGGLTDHLGMALGGSGLLSSLTKGVGGSSTASTVGSGRR